MTAALDVFGPIVGPYTIEAAAVAHLQTWLWPTYLEAVEQLNGITVGTIQKPDLAAIYGVFDENDFIAERMPGVMVSCVTPEGSPERSASVGYSQQYELQVWSFIVNDDTFTARRDAGLYTQAVMGAILEQFAGANPTLVSDVWMTSAPSVLLPNPDVRTIYLGHVAFNVYVSPIVIDSAGPLAPVPLGKTAPDWPDVESENLTVTGEPLS